MPAKSKAQKTAMCMALAARKGDLEVSKLKGAALEIYNSDMTNKEIEEFTVMESLQNYINKNMKNLTEYINESLFLLEKYEYVRLLNTEVGEDFDDYICVNNSTSIMQLLKKEFINDKVSGNNVDSYMAFLQANIKDICKYLYLYHNEKTSKWAVSSSLLTSDDGRAYLFAEDLKSEKLIKWLKSNLKKVISNQHPK